MMDGSRLCMFFSQRVMEEEEEVHIKTLGKFIVIVDVFLTTSEFMHVFLTMSKLWMFHLTMSK